MRKSLWILAIVPALSLAQANPATKDKPATPDRTARGPGMGPGRGAGPGAALDNPEMLQRIEKRVRLAATLGLSEALDLDEKGAMKVRDIFAKDIETRAGLMRQVRDNMRIVRDAARGDQAAGNQVDGALTKLRDARAQMQKLDDETFQQITNGLSSEKKAKAALFLGRFHERGRRMAMAGGRGGGWGGQGMGPGRERGMMGPGRGGPGGRGFGPGPGFAPGQGGPGGPPSGAHVRPQLERQAFNQLDAGDPALEDWYADED
jgi:hypothetical protein